MTLIFDGQCPFCSRYSQYATLRARWDIRLLDARIEKEKVRELAFSGYDINKGMILIIGNNIFQGSRALSALASLSRDERWYDILIRATFRYEKTAKLLYPILFLFRKVTLKILGRANRIDLS